MNKLKGWALAIVLSLLLWGLIIFGTSQAVSALQETQSTYTPNPTYTAWATYEPNPTYTPCITITPTATNTPNEPTPYPTYTPYPTQTPYPTYTPYPTQENCWIPPVVIDTPDTAELITQAIMAIVGTYIIGTALEDGLSNR